MAITVKERWEGRGATTNEKGVRTLKRQWSVETDSNTTGEPAVVDAVIAHDASAALYHAHPNWPSAVCRELTATPNGGPKIWFVDAAYSSAPFEARGDGSGTGGNDEQPTAAQSNETQANLRPPKISINRKEVTRPLEFHQGTEDPVVNSVGDPFIPPVEVFRSNHLITFKFHRLPADLNWAVRSQYMDKINSTSFTILGREYEAFSLRVVEYSLETEWETGDGGLSLFFAITCQLEYNVELWNPDVLNTGRRKMIGSEGDIDNPRRLVMIVDDQGQPVADPVPLTEAGEPVAPGGDYHYIAVTAYTPISFSGLLA